MTTYEHLCRACNKEFEDIYGMTDPVPTKCPLCEVDGQVERLISGGSGKGRVELTGHELKAQIQKDTQELKRAAMKDEKLLANLVGESKYQQNTVQTERILSEKRPTFKRRKSQ